MKYSNYFKTKQRADGTKFVCLTDEAPEVLKKFIRSVHFDYFGGCLPNDWIYEQIDHAFGYFEVEGNEFDNICVEADVYNADLLGWLHEPFALDYCKEAADELGGANGDIIQDTAEGQWLAKDRIYRAVSEFLENEGEDVSGN